MDDFVIICNMRLDLQYVVAVLICIRKDPQLLSCHVQGVSVPMKIKLNKLTENRYCKNET